MLLLFVVVPLLSCNGASRRGLLRQISRTVRVSDRCRRRGRGRLGQLEQLTNSTVASRRELYCLSDLCHTCDGCHCSSSYTCIDGKLRLTRTARGAFCVAYFGVRQTSTLSIKKFCTGTRGVLGALSPGRVPCRRGLCCCFACT